MKSLIHNLDHQACLLDLGCGKGSFSYRECRSRIVALDSALADVAPATSQKTERVHCVVGNGAGLPLMSGIFDLVIANHVFEHVEHPRQVAREISRVLKPTGVLFASIPDGFSFADNMYRWWTGGGGHIQRYTFRAFQEVIERNTDLSLLFFHRLYTSFSFLNPDPRADGHIAALSQSLKHLPRLARVGVIAAANILSRSVDASFGTRSSLYGWAFWFGKPGAVLTSVPTEETINVCGFCGCGHSTAWLVHSGKVYRRYGVKTFLCETCGCRNPFFGLRYLRRLVGHPPDVEELPNLSMCSSLAKNAVERGNTKHYIKEITTPFVPALMLAPGMQVMVRGENFSAAEENVASGDWPLELGGVELLVNESPIPLSSVSPTTIVGHLPFSTFRGTAAFAVRSRGVVCAAHNVAISLTAPTLLTRDQSGSGLGAFYHHDTGKPVTVDNPARSGRFVTCRALGLGPVVPPVGPGRLAASNPLSITTRRAVARIGEHAVPVLYCGLAPDTVGLYQLNMQIPRRIPNGEYPFVLEIGGHRSNVVTIACSR